MTFNLHIFKLNGGHSYITDENILNDDPSSRDVFWPRKFEIVALNDLRLLLSTIRTKFIKFYRNLKGENDYFNEMIDLVIWNDMLVVEDHIFDMYRRVALAIPNENNRLSGNIRNFLYLPTRENIMTIACKLNKLLLKYNYNISELFDIWKLSDDISRQIHFEIVIISDGNYEDNDVLNSSPRSLLNKLDTERAKNELRLINNDYTYQEHRDKQIQNELHRLLNLIKIYITPVPKEDNIDMNTYQVYEQWDYWNWQQY